MAVVALSVLGVIGQFMPVLVAGAISLGSFLAVAFFLFAAMWYLKWLGPRMGSDRVTRWAGTLVWVLPLLATVGILLLLLGPLAALVLYLVMLNWTRADLGRLQGGGAVV